MKRYDLHKGEACDCNAEMMESSIGDWVYAVEAINTISRLKQQLSAAQAELQRYADAVEVGGKVLADGDLFLIEDIFLNGFAEEQRVRVLVMPVKEQEGAS